MAMVIQNWNNIIQYIKLNLGQANLLEFSDNEIINILKEHTLPEFSVYISRKHWVLLTPSDQISSENTLDIDTYKIPLPEGYQVISVDRAYTNQSNPGAIEDTDLNRYMYYQTNPMDIVINNTLSTMLNSLDTVQYYELLLPDTIVFGKSLNGAGVILELSVYHDKLDTIPRDAYHKLFKPMALKNIIEYIIANRSKFTNLSSPFGEINLNMDILINKLTVLEAQVNDFINFNPPDILIDWIE